MKRAVGVLLGIVGLVAVAAQADDVRIGYVDFNKVMTESKAGKRALAEIDKLVKQRRDTLGREEQQLKDMQQAYEKDKLILSDTQREKKEQEFQKRLRAFQESRTEAEHEVEQKKREFERQAVPQIRKIIQDLAREQKLTLVFEKNQMPVLYAADGPDLTEKVIQLFDAKGG